MPYTSSSSINKKITIISVLMWGCIASFISLLAVGLLLSWWSMIVISFVFLGSAIGFILQINKLRKRRNISEAFEYPVVNNMTYPMAVPYVPPMSVPASFPASPPIVNIV